MVQLQDKKQEMIVVLFLDVCVLHHIVRQASQLYLLVTESDLDDPTRNTTKTILAAYQSRNPRGFTGLGLQFLWIIVKVLNSVQARNEMCCILWKVHWRVGRHSAQGPHCQNFKECNWKEETMTFEKHFHILPGNKAFLKGSVTGILTSFLKVVEIQIQNLGFCLFLCCFWSRKR